MGDINVDARNQKELAQNTFFKELGIFEQLTFLTAFEILLRFNKKKSFFARNYYFLLIYFSKILIFHQYRISTRMHQEPILMN